jgi:hypothetical protein
MTTECLLKNASEYCTAIWVLLDPPKSELNSGKETWISELSQNGRSKKFIIMTTFVKTNAQKEE